MTLVEYIKQIGDAEAAALWKVKLRTVASWRRRERKPRPEQADVIVRTSPVTYAGIYGVSDQASCAQVVAERRKSDGRRSTDKGNKSP